ncbi:MAG TPA: DUF1801 domain-containing protein [Aggregatilineales bacterium]|nr:DUF1801 domain-containing protein [Chloroflexota bacterium]HOA23704.1 DUF1801 domain-containing protein [Aggregatilineales bacterium]HPV05746.1 DUF1801 domain-containing protein [Aggregatilineales bacterium]HQA66884.1 DUF1801 domain-containing protein [Aggregatilineales bacterium]HQE17339.1 DUF1801 domain-containing protein [Aggregatilineales bacterium]
MSENKLVPTDQDVHEFLAGVEREQKRQDSYELLQMMQEITGEPPVMWGSSIVGFGKLHYKYASGREGDTFIVGFSPRKQSFSLYLNCGFDGAGDLLDRLGKHRIGSACLYVNKLDDVDREVLRALVERSVAEVRGLSAGPA